MEGSYAMKKATKKVSLAIVLAFVLYNIIWYAAVNAKYSQYIAGFEEIYAHRTYALVGENGYTYNVKIPDYLSSVGNLGIQQSEDGSCALIIWPKFVGKTEYGVLISAPTGTSSLMLTESREPIAGTPEATQELFEEYRGEIDALFDEADAMWNLGSL